MSKRRNKKVRRKIELLVKICIFIIGVFALIYHNVDKKTSLSAPSISETPPVNNVFTEKKIPMQGLSQEGIPTGCESVSAVALLQHFGIDIDVDTFIKEYLPCQDFYYKNGELYGANPHEAFAGNPYKKSSLGCYPEVIMKALSKMKSNEFVDMNFLEFQNISGTDLHSICDLYINSNIPVLLWITIDLKEPAQGMQYYLEDGSLYTWTKHEHCVVLCGYDEVNYYFMDPLADGQIVTRDKELVELRYEQLGKYALILKPNT